MLFCWQLEAAVSFPHVTPTRNHLLESRCRYPFPSPGRFRARLLAAVTYVFLIPTELNNFPSVYMCSCSRDLKTFHPCLCGTVGWLQCNNERQIIIAYMSGADPGFSEKRRGIQFCSNFPSKTKTHTHTTHTHTHTKQKTKKQMIAIDKILALNPPMLLTSSSYKIIFNHLLVFCINDFIAFFWLFSVSIRITLPHVVHLWLLRTERWGLFTWCDCDCDFFFAPDGLYGI